MIGLIEVVFRVSLLFYLEYYLHDSNVSDIIVGYGHQWDIIRECYFSVINDLPFSSLCEQFSHTKPIFQSIYSAINPVITESVLLRILLGIGIQYINAYLLTIHRKTDKVESNIPWQYYWYNPIIFLSALYSPVPSLVHFLILLLEMFILNGIIVIPCFLIMVLSMYNVLFINLFILIVPFYYREVNKESNENLFHFHIKLSWNIIKKIAVEVTGLFLILLGLCFMHRVVPVCYYSFDWMISNEFTAFQNEFKNLFNVIQRDVYGFTHLIQQLVQNFFYLLIVAIHQLFNPTAHIFDAAYRPNAGVIWYLDAQVFRSYASQFRNLVFIQPFLYTIPILVRVASLSPHYAVRWY
jgi:hypothetical protein